MDVLVGYNVQAKQKYVFFLLSYLTQFFCANPKHFMIILAQALLKTRLLLQIYLPTTLFLLVTGYNTIIFFLCCLKTILQSTFFFQKRIIIHELGHAIGFYHEQSRPDRDQYVNIYLNNVRADKRSNFRKYNWNVINSFGVPYDYYSVMHYSRKVM